MKFKTKSKKKERRLKLFRNHKKYFDFSIPSLTLALLLSVLGSFYVALNFYILPKHHYFIMACIGVFVAAVFESTLIRCLPIVRFKYGFLLSLFSGLTAFLGSYSYSFPILYFVLLFFLLCCTGLAAHFGPDIYNGLVFVTAFFIIGGGDGALFKVAFIDGISVAIGGLSLSLGSFLISFFIPKREGLHYLSSCFVIPQKVDKTQIEFTVKLILAVFMATFASRYLSIYMHLPEGFWIPMTSLYVLRRETHATKERMAQRFLGTVLGSLICLPLALYISNYYILLFIIAITLFLSIIALIKHYGSYVVFLTVMITLILKLLMGSGEYVIGLRLLNTALGLLCVLVVVSVSVLFRPRS